jgi:hypothetical protein
MFNKRLLVDVKTQEEKFFKAFHFSPYAITLTRLIDGQIIEVNIPVRGDHGKNNGRFAILG